MAVSATLSIMALYRYDSTLFDGMQLPEGVDKDTLVDNILLDAASLEVLYPDPVFLNRAITVWSRKRLPVWNELQKTLEYEYNPIDNYDRTETVTEGIERSGSGSSSRSGTNTGSGNSKTDTENSSSSSGTNTGTASNTAYNSDSFADTAKNVTSGSSTGSNEGSSTTTSSSSETISETGETESSSSEDRTMTTRTRGNIGVTTTQQMIMAQREVVSFNLLDVIEDEFIAKFCLAVY